MAVAPYTLAQLLSAQGPDQVRAKLLAILGADPNPGNSSTNVNHGFPVADWLSNPAGMEMAFINMFRQSLYDLVTSKMPAQIASGWLAKAGGDYLTFHADLFYEVDRNPPTKTVFNLQLSSTASAQPYDFGVGDVWVLGASGHRYVSTQAGHLDAGGTLVLAFEAEFAGASANDNPAASPPTLVTAFAGVTVSAAIGDFTDVFHLGDGTGHLTFQRLVAGFAPASGTYAIRIDTSGDVGVGLFSLSFNNGPFVAIGLIGTVGLTPPIVFDATNALVTAFNGAGSPASFLSGDEYIVTSPGGTSYIQGSDEEGDESLRQRCRTRWPSISLNQTRDVLILWTKQAAPSVTRVAVIADPLVPGRALIYAADSRGGIDPVSVTAIAAYITPKLGSVLDSVSVAPTEEHPVSAAGSVYVTATTVAAVQAKVRAAWSAYLSTIPIGGTVILAELEQIIMDAGAKDISGLGIDSQPNNVFLASNEIPVIDGDIISTLGWFYL